MSLSESLQVLMHPNPTPQLVETRTGELNGPLGQVDTPDVLFDSWRKRDCIGLERLVR